MHDCYTDFAFGCFNCVIFSFKYTAVSPRICCLSSVGVAERCLSIHAVNVQSVSCVTGAGWEYSVEATLGGYGAVEKAYHLCRRRRLVRQRQLVQPSKAKVDSEEKVGCISLPCFVLFCPGMVL